MRPAWAPSRNTLQSGGSGNTDDAVAAFRSCAQRHGQIRVESDAEGHGIRGEILDDLMPMQPAFLKSVGQAVAEGEWKHRPCGFVVGEFEFDPVGFLGRDFPGGFPGESMGWHGVVLPGPGVMVIGAGHVVVAHQRKEQGAARPHLAGVSGNDRIVVMQGFHDAVAREGSLVSDQPSAELGQHLGHGSGLIPDLYARSQ